MTNTVALIGRPNVGKSTIFNALIKKRKSIVLDTPGVTRDRIYEDAYFKDYKFKLIDTGGIDSEELTFNEEIKIQATIAIDEADVIVFVVDGKEGLTSDDLYIRNLLRNTKKPIIVAINKVDSKDFKEHKYDFYELGFDNYVEVSSESNMGMYELCENITSHLVIREEEKNDLLKISIVGRPNVGKSSLVNSLLNEDRLIVSSIAGTTRDSVDTILKYHNEEYCLIDTAGLRKKGKVYENIEKYSYMRSIKSIEDSDISLLVINAAEGVIEHDKHIAGYILEKGKGIILVVNKWDLSEEKKEDYIKMLRNEFQFIPYAPIIFTSNVTKKGIGNILPMISKVKESITKEVKTSVINDLIMEAYQMKLPPTYKMKRLKIFFVSQIGSKPPKFLFRVNDDNLIHFAYKRYLVNRIRENIDFTGTPIVLEFKGKKEEK